MTFDKFSRIIERLKSHSDRIQSAYSLKIDLIDFDDDLNRVIDDLVREGNKKQCLRSKRSR